MNRLFVRLDSYDLKILLKEAIAERRHPSDHAAVLLQRALREIAIARAESGVADDREVVDAHS